jgi:hypothetical protein
LYRTSVGVRYAGGVIRIAFAILAAAALAAPAAPRPQTPIGKFAVDEVSGLVASRRHPGVYWAIRDSGPGARAALLAIRVAGDRLVPWPGGAPVKTLPVAGARNVDWEEVTIDDAGSLWIADTGNNAEGRTDLKLYRVPEPDPAHDGAARVAAVHPFRYPDKPAWGASFDAEALFFLDGRAYLVTKTAAHGVYAFPKLQAGVPVTLERLGSLAQPPRGLDGLVSGASIARDGRRLAIVTGRRRVWIYAAAAPGLTGDALVKDLVARPPRWSAAFDAEEAAWQVEAVAFGATGHDLLLAAEEGFIWRFPRAFYEAYPPP